MTRSRRKAMHEKQREDQARAVYEFIRTFIEEEGHSPSFTEIAEGCFISKGSALRYVDWLEAWGYIRREPNTPRTISLVDPERRL